MSITRHDYIMRLLSQFAQFLAALAGKKAQGRVDEADEMIEEALDALLGPMRRSIDVLDAQSAAMILGDRDRLRVYAQLLAEKADILKTRGDLDQARWFACRSEELASRAGDA